MSRNEINMNPQDIYNTINISSHQRTMLLRGSRQLFDSTSFFDDGNSFQKRRVWSPEPVRMLYSHGDFAK